jgi:hypothetical protein
VARSVDSSCRRDRLLPPPGGVKQRGVAGKQQWCWRSVSACLSLGKDAESPARGG